MRTFLVAGALLLPAGAAVAQPSPAPAPASRPRFGLVAGMNFATLDFDDPSTDELVETKVGLAVGGVAQFPFSPVMSFESGALLSQKGARYDLDGLGGGEASVDLTYLEVPVLLRFHVPTAGSMRPMFGVGGAVGFLLSAKAKFEGDTEDIEDDTSNVDVGLAVGAGLEFSLGGAAAIVEGRYTHGLSNIAEDSADADTVEVKNRVLTLLAGVMF